MSLGEVKKLLFPFRPVRMHVSDGQSYRIEHPEFFILFEHKLIVAVPSKTPGVAANDVHLSLLHITAIEELRQKAQKSK